MSGSQCLKSQQNNTSRTLNKFERDPHDMLIKKNHCMIYLEVSHSKVSPICKFKTKCSRRKMYIILLNRYLKLTPWTLVLLWFWLSTRWWSGIRNWIWRCRKSNVCVFSHQYTKLTNWLFPVFSFGFFLWVLDGAGYNMALDVTLPRSNGNILA